MIWNGSTSTIMEKLSKLPLPDLKSQPNAQENPSGLLQTGSRMMHTGQAVSKTKLCCISSSPACILP
jgi:hypothetical protein